jgi:hypothetical protein
VRFLRKARELAYRDLGGLVYNLHRFGQRNDSLVLAKLATLSRIDAELRGLEAALSERQPVTVLREAGITACPRCAAIHSGEDRFCPNCGLPMSRRSDLPIAGVPAAASAPPPGAQVTPGAHVAPITQVAPGAASGGPAGAPGVPGVPGAPGFGATSPASAPPAPPTPPSEPPRATPLPPTPATTPARAPTPPATQTHATLTRDGGGRGSGAPDGGRASDDDDQPTEIIRPRTSGS